jgi:hypothetical protein
MEGDSQEEDDTLRNYWTKKKEKKKKREKEKCLEKAESVDNEGQDKHEGNSLDSTKLTILTSADEDTLHTSSTLEEHPSSPLYTSHLGLQDNEANPDDDFLDFNDFTSETTLPKPPDHASQDEE